MIITLSQNLARNGQADPYDVRQVKKALNRLGYYQLYAKTGVTGLADADLFNALQKFQTDAGLKPSGTLKPGDETVAALNNQAIAAPEGSYI